VRIACAPEAEISEPGDDERHFSAGAYARVKDERASREK
jgi:hypothetical protein